METTDRSHRVVHDLGWKVWRRFCTLTSTRLGYLPTAWLAGWLSCGRAYDQSSERRATCNLVDPLASQPGWMSWHHIGLDSTDNFMALAVPHHSTTRGGRAGNGGTTAPVAAPPSHGSDCAHHPSEQPSSHFASRLAPDSRAQENQSHQ